ncbi:SubName: Full=Uncharacterized protein {ECO:0000313/EMBL:CCA74552.1} [Serendipita indica DSM 11827]|nr:SubName: Full=Uncharacterized protein {ECO:0000313/EMBL:CCA74552.1} [Serendipita indica DSM 11827]
MTRGLNGSEGGRNLLDSTNTIVGSQFPYNKSISSITPLLYLYIMQVVEDDPKPQADASGETSSHSCDQTPGQSNLPDFTWLQMNHDRHVHSESALIPAIPIHVKDFERSDIRANLIYAPSNHLYKYFEHASPTTIPEAAVQVKTEIPESQMAGNSSP